MNDVALRHMQQAEDLLGSAETLYLGDLSYEQTISAMNGHLALAMLYMAMPPENPPMPGSAYL